MKTVTVREFYHNAGMVDGLAERKQVLVTAKGKPKFLASQAARPSMTRKLAEARAVGDAKGLPFDGAAFLASRKK